MNKITNYPKYRKLFEIGIAPSYPSLNFSLSKMGLELRIWKLNIGFLVIRVKEFKK